MTLESKTTLGIAILGAVTGTIALAVQLLQHWHDRAKIKLSGRMSLSSNITDPVERYEFQLDVVNKGRRIARISEVYIETAKEKPGARFKIFDADGHDAIALEEGETKRFGDRITTNSLDGLFESFEAKEFFSVRLRSPYDWGDPSRAVLDREEVHAREVKKEMNKPNQEGSVERSRDRTIDEQAPR